MFNEGGTCFLHAGFPVKCNLCFNFSTATRIVEKGKTKPYYTLYDYIRSTGDIRKIFPTGESIQKTL